jgi:DNA-binding transcriptional LysR family regulator
MGRGSEKRMRAITLKQLRAFTLIARHHSLALAAAELHLSASAVSLQMKELEQAAGLALLDRSGKGVQLTPAGELLLSDAKKALSALEHADDELARIRGPQREAVAIGMLSSAKYFLPRVLAQFHGLHPHVDLHLSVANRDRLVEGLKSGRIDLAVMGSPPPELIEHADGFAEQPLGVVASPTHHLARERSINPSALNDHSFIVREPGSGTRAAMDRFFHDAGVVPHRVMEISNNEAIKEAVMACLGLAFMSLHAAGPELQGSELVLLDIVNLPIMRGWFIVRTCGHTLNSGARTLRRFILDEGEASITQRFHARLFQFEGGRGRAADRASAVAMR